MKFEYPEIEVAQFAVADILTTSETEHTGTLPEDWTPIG